MKREILFRGKRKNGQWVYGSLVVSENIAPAIYYEVGKGVAKQLDWCYVNPDTIGQYTGLKDKNGVKIFEGDILDYTLFDTFGEDHQYKGVVKWIDDCFICDNSDGFNGFAWVVNQSLELEVIGNITDNPELLK
jgi:hypothetical protein|nr:MAG TPA: YopX protein [Caudoviricetes sp.]DAS18745.1 MAG TPA: YopX protein [Caudoviricetes sp.]